MRKWPVGVSMVLTALLVTPCLQAQTHILFGDVMVHEEKANPAYKSSFRIILTSITGTVIGRQPVSNGGRYRFLSVSNGDYILSVELGSQEIARMPLLINELRSTDIKRDLEFEWKERFPAAKPGKAELVYARSGEQEQLLRDAQRAQEGGDLSAAVDLLIRLTGNDAEDFEAWTELGSVEFRQNNLKAAEEAYLRALELQPGLVVAHHNLGKLYIQQKQFDKAITQLEPVVLATPQLAEAHFLLGEAFLQVKKGSQAVIHLERAVDLEPEKMAEAHLRLGRLYQAAGYSVRAVTEYRNYLKKRPNSPGKKEIEKYIRENSSKP